MLAAAIPISVSGLGVFEGVLNVLYVQLGEGANVVAGTGTVVGLAYRVITIGIAIIGFGYYLANRAIVRQVMKQADKSAELDAIETPDVATPPDHRRAAGPVLPASKPVHTGRDRR